MKATAILASLMFVACVGAASRAIVVGAKPVRGEERDGGYGGYPCIYTAQVVNGRCEVIQSAGIVGGRAPDVDLFRVSCGSRFQVCGRSAACDCSNSDPLPLCPGEHPPSGLKLPSGHYSSEEWQAARMKELGAEPKIGGRHGVIEKAFRRCDYSISFASAGECGLTWGEHDMGSGIGDYMAEVPLGQSKVLCGTPVKCECPPGPHAAQ